MNSMYAGIIVSFLFVGLLFILQYLRIRYLHGITIHRTIPTIHRLFSPPNSTAQDLLAARAVPNTRLILAFALTNTFVSDNIDIHATFVGSATLLLKAATERGWPHFQQVAIDAVDAALLGGGQLSFDVLVQDVTMRVALIGLLGVDTAISELDSRDICMVATLITTLWSLSKKPDHIPPDLLLLLNRHLRRLIPDEQAYPNPLDYLIPVWETLWRVVAVTVAYADKHCYGDKVFAELQRLPTITQFRAFGDSLPSVEWFITEAMRLHPPSKHIARSFVRPSASTSTLPLFFQTLLTKAIGPLVHRECADIETVLRSEDIWGADADKFDPLRYRPSRVTQEQERIKWLAFGHGRYRCVAAAWAPMAAGIISAAILDRLKVGSDLRLVEGDCVGAREGWRGWYLSRN